MVDARALAAHSSDLPTKPLVATLDRNTKDAVVLVLVVGDPSGNHVETWLLVVVVGSSASFRGCLLVKETTLGLIQDLSILSTSRLRICECSDDVNK